MRSIVFEGNTWNAYEELQEKNKKIHQDMCRILKELQRGDPTQGTGKPEALRYHLTGFYSRRISLKDRLIYRFDDKNIYIFAIGGHYDQ
jgi:toxin YoeB